MAVQPGLYLRLRKDHLTQKGGCFSCLREALEILLDLAEVLLAELIFGVEISSHDLRLAAYLCQKCKQICLNYVLILNSQLPVALIDDVIFELVDNGILLDKFPGLISLDGIDDDLKRACVFEPILAADLFFHVGLNYDHMLHLFLNLEVLQFLAQG